MKRPGCAALACPFEPIPERVRVVVTFLVGALLITPLIRNGLDVTQGAQQTALKLLASTALIPEALAVVLAMVLAHYRPTDDWYDLLSHAAGFPGAVIALTAAAQH